MTFQEHVKDPRPLRPKATKQKPRRVEVNVSAETIRRLVAKLKEEEKAK